MSLLSWLVVALCAYSLTCQTLKLNSKEEHVIIIPVQIQLPDSMPQQRSIEVDIYVDDIPTIAFPFCETNGISSDECLLLLDHIAAQAADARKALESPHSRRLLEPIAPPTAKRHQPAHEIDDAPPNFDGVTSSEEAVLRLLRDKWAGRRMERVSFLHSCQVNNVTDTRILERMLGQISDSGILNRLDTLVVLNYGPAIDQAVKDKHSYKIEWIQVHPEIVYFEVPTLRIMHRMVKHLTDVQPDVEVQVLYLHTKGVSYEEVIPSVQDWADLMMYFLVEKHNTCLHLLQSGVVDCVGTLYHETSPYSTEQDHFSGNFWWATGSYLASRPELKYEESGKYEAELWLLRLSHARIFVPHNDGVDHYTMPYPRSCYASPPSQRNDSLCGGPQRFQFPKYVELGQHNSASASSLTLP